MSECSDSCVFSFHEQRFLGTGGEGKSRVIHRPPGCPNSLNLASFLCFHIDLSGRSGFCPKSRSFQRKNGAERNMGGWEGWLMSCLLEIWLLEF
jgi:hypothetical protein